MAKKGVALSDLGWNDRLEAEFAALALRDAFAARVIREDRGEFRILSERGERRSKVTGHFRNKVESRAEYPAVGDWVAASFRKSSSLAEIHAVLSRISAFSRKGVQDNDYEQIVAANVDFVFLISGLDAEFNIRRLERYLTLAWESKAKPVIILNKADLCDDTQQKLDKVTAIAPDTDICITSALESEGIEALSAYLQPGKTVAFLGSSGVGKSTLINAILGENRQKTAATRSEDGKGRHTTTHRELIVVPERGLLIDTPGMRELQLWADEQGLAQAFEDITKLSTTCKFRDCRHNAEPGCAVQSGVQNGILSVERLESWRKQREELDRLIERQKRVARKTEHGRWRKVRKLIKQDKNRSHNEQE